MPARLQEHPHLHVQPGGAALQAAGAAPSAACRSASAPFISGESRDAGRVAGVQTRRSTASRPKRSQAMAICFLHAYANPENEQSAAAICRERFDGEVYVTSSHEILPVSGEYERFSTTVVSAYLGPIVSAVFHRAGTAAVGDGLQGQSAHHAFGRFGAVGGPFAAPGGDRCSIRVRRRHPSPRHFSGGFWGTTI